MKMIKISCEGKRAKRNFNKRNVMLPTLQNCFSNTKCRKLYSEESFALNWSRLESFHSLISNIETFLSVVFLSSREKLMLDGSINVIHASEQERNLEAQPLTHLSI